MPNPINPIPYKREFYILENYSSKIEWKTEKEKTYVTVKGNINILDLDKKPIAYIGSDNLLYDLNGVDLNIFLS
jgi:hypothetical protein